MPKTYCDVNVWDAAMQRMRFVFDRFPKVYVSFSGGKDSGITVELALRIAKELGRLPLDVLYIDFEAQYKNTIDYVREVMSRDSVRPHWVCLPLHLRNSVSQITPHWLCWDEVKRGAWVRDMPTDSGVISGLDYFPFFRRGMEFEEFAPAFGEWFAGGEDTACIVAIRSDESLNRFRTIRCASKETAEGRSWTTRIGERIWNCYPIYDWTTEDVWTAYGRERWQYNKIYDLMHLAGVSLHQMRLCQPYGDDQRRGLWLFKMLEAETWMKVVNRVEGANFGNRYSNGQSHIMGNFKVSLPDGHSYKSYAKFLLSTMPPSSAEHYRRKITTFLRWWKKHRHDDTPSRDAMRRAGMLPNWRGIPDSVDKKLESGTAIIEGVRCRLPSWRRIVKVLLKNDWWCKGLSFSQTKREMESQLERACRLSSSE